MSNDTLHKKHFFRVVLLIALALSVYASSLTNGFVWDDNVVIVDNPLLAADSHTLGKLLLSEDRLPGVQTGYYRPVMYLSYVLDRELWGLNPFGYHLTNILLHIGVTVAFYALTYLLFRSGALAFLSALFLSLHPINAETVNFLSGGRNTLLAALFMLIAFILYIRRRRLLSVSFFTLSIFSKEFGLLLPLLLMYYDRILYSPDGAADNEPRSGNAWAHYLPFGIAIIAYLIARSIAIGGSGIDFDLSHLPNRIMLLPELVFRYCRLLLVPVGLKVPYVVIPPRTFGVGVALSWAGLLTILFLAFTKTRSLITRFSLLWFFLYLAPVSNIIPLGYIIMADRYAYFSSMGFSLLLAHALLAIKGNRIRIGLLTSLSLFYGVMILSSTPQWKDNYTFYTSMTRCSPESSIGFQNLGMYYYERGEVERARDALNQALKGFPRLDESYFSLGVVYWELGDPDRALDFINTGLSKQEGTFKTYYILGRLYEAKGNGDMSARSYAKARELFPDVESAMKQRALIFCIDAEKLQGARKRDEAEKLFQRALLFDPESARALLGLGSVIAEKGDVDKALEYFKRASDIEPANPLPHYNLSLGYRLQGRIGDAEAEMARFRELGGSPPVQ